MLSYYKVLRYLNANTLSLSHLKNRVRLMRSYQQRSSHIAAFPVVLQIELSNRCNLQCIMCPRQGMTRSRGDMDPALFRKIIDEAAGKAEFAILHLLGDSLLNPHLYEMIDQCREAGIRTVLSTNGTLLNEKHARRLRASQLDILILSFDGFRRETYEKVRKNASYSRTLRNVERFLKLPPLRHPHTIVQMIAMKETREEAKEFLGFWKGYPAQALIKPFTQWQGDIASINALSDNSGGGPLAALRDKVCDRAWRWLTVYQDGTVVPCCRDYDGAHPVGNLREGSVSEVWNSEPMVHFREQHLLGRDRLEICRTCDYHPLIADSALVRMGLTLFDMYAVTRLMYDMEYGVD